MIKLYIDDSSQDEPPVYALGGVCATDEQWEIISKEWDNAVYLGWKLPPPFKYNRVMQWPDEVRTERLNFLMELVQRNSKFLVLTVVDHAALKIRMAEAEDPNLVNRFYFCYFNTLIRILNDADRIGENKIQFIFDRENGNMALVQNEWARFRSSAPQSALNRLAHQPIFGDDATSIPLQVADFVVGMLRQKFTAEGLGAGKFVSHAIPGVSCTILNCIWTDGDLRVIAEDMRRLELARKAAAGDISAVREIFSRLYSGGSNHRS